ncbi:glutathione S-transferase T3-like [Rosa rugosa]|uniref:glutathione S-transferase T3-like n=1 Tax=Rosa rugosa TaxID=74645 RepID=UPI002B40A203|nr:glutathione S-transferase T3-like [Rosa rugosa]
MAPRGDSWRHNEEVILCQAWITVGGDGCVGKDQKSDLLWSRVADEYNAHKPAGCMERTHSSCHSRWKRISPACMKWRQALNKVEHFQRRSGENMEDELMNVKSTYYDSEGCDFVFEHCWQYLKNTEKFGKTPSMENTHFSSNHVNLDSDEPSTTEDELPSSRKARPQGQKAQKLAKKKSNKQDADGLRVQMQKCYEQTEREYQQRQRQFEEGQLIEQRAEDARTMQVDPSIFTPRKRSYWERKQQQIIDKETSSSSIPEQSQYPTPPEGDNTGLTTYDPLGETSWM